MREMEENWIEFDEGPSSPRDRNHVSMNRFGEILLNRHTFEEMGRPEAVVLLYDPDNNKIGLKPTSPMMPNAFDVKPKGNHRLVRAKPFMMRHDFRIDGTVRFQGVEVKNCILSLSLRSMINVKRPPRNSPVRR